MGDGIVLGSLGLQGIVKMVLGSVGLIVSGIICYIYLKEGVKLKKSKMAMRAARKSMYMKNEVNISKQEIKSFNYDTDYLDEISSVNKSETQMLKLENKEVLTSADTDYLDEFEN